MDDPIAPRRPAAAPAGPLFAGLQQWEMPQFDTRLPLFIPDFGSITAVYHAATERVEPLLPHPDLRPVEVLPGRCLVVFSALEYRESDLGPYNELAIAFPVGVGRLPALAAALRDLATGSASAFVWQMPVTTERSRAAGAGLAGYPKFLADIDFERQGSQLACTVAQEGRRIATLWCETGPARSERQLHVKSYTMREGRPLTTHLRVHQRRTEEHLHGRSATLQLGEHPLADTLRTLDLGAQPLASQYCPQAQAVMFFPRQADEP